MKYLMYKKGVIIIQKFIHKAKKGNKKAFLKCIEMYEADLYRMAFIYMKNEHDALDVVQETIVKAFEKINTLREPSYFKTWLIKIAINVSLGKLNKASRIVTLEQRQLDSIQIPNSDISLKLTLQNLINELSSEEKHVIILRFYQDYKFAEMAEILEIPIGTVKSTCYRALNKLRIQIEEVDFYE